MHSSIGILLMCFDFQQQHFSAPHYGPNTAAPHYGRTGSSYFLTWVLLSNNTTDLGRTILCLNLCQGRAELDLWQHSMFCFLKHNTRAFPLTRSQQTQVDSPTHSENTAVKATSSSSALRCVILNETCIALKYKFMGSFNASKFGAWRWWVWHHGR